MAYGSSACGSTAYGGNANSVNEQVFFPLPTDLLAPDVLYERSVFFNGPESFYEILIRQESENPSGPNGAEYKIYTSSGEGITPQLQMVVGGQGQTIIAAAPIVIVTALVDSSIWVSGLGFSIVGRPYTQ
jgi:hypothetical protein